MHVFQLFFFLLSKPHRHHRHIFSQPFSSLSLCRRQYCSVLTSDCFLFNFSLSQILKKNEMSRKKQHKKSSIFQDIVSLEKNKSLFCCCFLFSLNCKTKLITGRREREILCPYSLFYVFCAVISTTDTFLSIDSSIYSRLCCCFIDSFVLQLSLSLSLFVFHHKITHHFISQLFFKPKNYSRQQLTKNRNFYFLILDIRMLLVYLDFQNT